MKILHLAKDKIIDNQKNMFSNDLKRQKRTSLRENYRDEDINIIKKLGNYKSVICIGARHDSEVKSFLNFGYSVKAIDIAVESELIERKDITDLEGNETFDITFCSHVLEHVYDPLKVLRIIRTITKKIVWIILPICPSNKKGPTIKHPTLYEIMKNVRDEDIFSNKEIYKEIWNDFNELEPYEILYGKFRPGITDKYEVVFALNHLGDK